MGKEICMCLHLFKAFHLYLPYFVVAILYLRLWQNLVYIKKPTTFYYAHNLHAMQGPVSLTLKMS